jgi:hypothetical protein
MSIIETGAEQYSNNSFYFSKETMCKFGYRRGVINAIPGTIKRVIPEAL